MAKSDSGGTGRSSIKRLESQVDLTLEKIRRYLLEDMLREAAAVVADELELVRRIKDGTSLSGVFMDIDGPIYTTVQVRRYTMEALCTCHASGPCAHGGALALQYLDEPKTFLDLEEWLTGLEERSKPELLEMLRTVLSSIPAALEIVGIPGFQGVLTAETPSEEEWWDEDAWEDDDQGLAQALTDDDEIEDLDGYLDDDEEPPDPETIN